jgi:hypothetical protein
MFGFDLRQAQLTRNRSLDRLRVFARASKGDGDYAAAIEGATVLLRSADAPTKPSYGETIKRWSARGPDAVIPSRQGP